MGRDRSFRVRQPCRQCGRETMCDAYIRENRVLCRSCAEAWDMKYDPANYGWRWCGEPEPEPSKLNSIVLR